MTDAPLQLSNTETDATKWAAEFDRVFPDSRPDTATMLAWFANAIMAGWDAATNRAAEKERRQAIDADHIQRQRDWSFSTFGPGSRHEGVRDHILKEMVEAETDPTEWIDVVILALDGAWRAGLEPQDIIDGVLAKQARNERRTWPDWRTQPQDRAIEHDRSVGDG